MLLGLTQAELARRAGISLRTLKTWEAGRLPIYMQGTSRLAAELGLSLDDLAGVAPRPDQSPVLARAVVTLRDVAEVQEGLVQQLQAVASQLAQVEDQGVDDHAAAG